MELFWSDKLRPRLRTEFTNRSWHREFGESFRGREVLDRSDVFRIALMAKL